MAYNASELQSIAYQNATIEALAKQTDMPVAVVKEIYITQHRQLEKDARVRSYLPVLISTRVKQILHERKLRQQRQITDSKG